MQKIIPTTLSNLATLMDTTDTKCQGVYMQADAGNTGNIFFGRSGNVDFFLEPGKSSTYLINNARDMFVRSENGTEVLSFDIMQE